MSESLICSQCGHEPTGAAKFCRRCGGEVVERTDVETAPEGEPAPTEVIEAEVCASCGAPARPGAAFCRSCGAPVGTKPEPVTAVPRSPQPAGAPRDSSGVKRLALYALAAIVVIGAGAGTAFALTSGGDDEDDGGGTEIAASSGPDSGESETDPGTAGEEPEPFVPEEADDQEDADPLTESELAGQFLTTHFQAIDDGRYDDAYDLFHPSYTTSRSDWVGDKEEEMPNISTESIVIEPSDHEALPGEVWLRLELPTRDGGGEFAGNCRILSGDVRMFAADGGFLYRPGLYGGVEPSLARSDLGGAIEDVPESDPRCP